jgi:hypothetical protein
VNQHRLNQISPRVHWLSPDSATDRPVLGAVVGSRATLLVDDDLDIAAEFIAGLE